ncbi:hypothetical protein CVS30_03105 [Arthrobacter psychrolactophilus]|uniref:Uncharacterized protein n=1 Tax=Arthrobacter psychrolactophilus TaxID=92442 RepID=A0A2V5J922_9MICC|nr:hypothetical protein [Arthrobacter psychrolactophilus]PYI39670.1 hypothetical protein CVS30_03105 [Arthrobacter psychrolactophilus]
MSEMPRYNPAPNDLPLGQAPVAPPIMNTVFFMLIGAAVLHVIASIFGIMYANSAQFREDAMKTFQDAKMTVIDESMVDTTVMVTVGTLIVMTVIAVILYVLIGLFLKKGMGWARIVGAILAVVSLYQLVGLTMPGGIATILQVLLGIGAMILCFTGAGAKYFAEKKSFKLANKMR